jgi:hypothetical protein
LDRNLFVSQFDGKPGTRLPHLWLDDEHHTSSLDWIAGSFTLIATEACDWLAAIRGIQQKFNVKVNLKIIDNLRVSKKWKEITGATNRQALLIRPDDFVVGKVTSEELLDQIAAVLHIDNHTN